MDNKKYAVSMSLYKCNTEQRYFNAETDLLDSKDDAYAEFERICESIERKEYKPDLIDYDTDGILVDLNEMDKYDDEDTYEWGDIIGTKEFSPKVESLEGCVLAVLVPQSSTQEKLIEVRMGYFSDTTELTNDVPHLYHPYTKVIMDADEASKYKTDEKLRQAVIDELNEPYYHKIINKDAIRYLVEQGVPYINI